MTDSGDIDSDELAEELTDEVLTEFSRLLGRDLSDEISDSGLQTAYKEAEQFIEEVDTILEPNMDEAELRQFMLEEYNQILARLLGLDDVEVDSLEGLRTIFGTIDSVMENIRFQIETLGHPEYYDTVEELVGLVIEAENSNQHLEAIIGSLDDVGERKLQRIFVRLDQDMELILENPDIESETTATDYLRMYERCCEQFKTLSPFVIYSTNVITEESGDIENRLNDNLDTLINMCSARQRLELFARQFDNDIRNAIAHDDFLVDPVDKSVEFPTDGETVVWSYTQIREQVVEARCAVLSLFVFPFLLQHRENVRALNEILQEPGVD
ncbi:hypothetical protein SAMN05192561_10587 [Halopenitus malekzadehii]|uniref:Uncharacterized protein n=1 Tax=Halopenitus malekzadehii TaxID=1267564 RepID=A0A1H6IWZ5_9EURY|nr:hypothetical protein [Halopenitus malekzadehii]SEH53698.1 hypothetical protein SAMN05192561_10587 [Halopenitus malekzadehii]